MMGILTLNLHILNRNHHFHYIVSDAPTVASLALERHPKIGLPSSFTPEVGQRIEVSLDRAVVAEEIASVVNTRQGAGLIIDYGTLYPPINTLRVRISHPSNHHDRLFISLLCTRRARSTSLKIFFVNQENSMSLLMWTSKISLVCLIDVRTVPLIHT